jgi:glycosyltransferase involved in cell wall biosynthesis
MTAPRVPRVVACMPAWNSESYIGPVLESLAAQTYPNLHVIISIDKCADRTAEICAQFAATRPNVRVIRQSERLGWIANSNVLLAAADGDYLFFAMHDDPLAPTYVARLVEALEADPRAVLAFSDLQANTGEAFAYDALDGIRSRFERTRRVLHGYGAWWVPFRGLMRASTVRELGGMRRHLGGEVSADLPWLLRFALAGDFARVREPLVFKRFHKKSLSSSWRRGGWSDFAVTLHCMGIVRKAGFPPRQALLLYSEALALSVGITACPPLLVKLRNAFRRDPDGATASDVTAILHEP